jgi:acetylornithine deacetylase
MNLNVVELTKDLVSYKSNSLDSNVPVTRRTATILRSLGFKVEELKYTDANGVNKISIVGKLGRGKGGLSLMSHDDTVPAAKEDGWVGDPFVARIAGGKLFARGSSDMKGPLAASISAASHFKAADLKAPLYIVVTADEEVSALGAKDVTARSKLFAEASSGYGVICEPTRLKVVHAHKGGLSVQVTSKGRSAHTSSLKGLNANLKMIPFLQEMTRLNELVLTARRFSNDEFGPPRSELTISINDHNIALNVSPDRSICRLSYRNMHGVDETEILQRIRASAKKYGLKFELKSNSEGVYTPRDSPLVKTSLKLTGKRRPTTVAYGTDGIAYVKKMKKLVVIGPGDIAQAHTVDEWIELDQLHKGVDLYKRFIERVCVQNLP